MSEEQSGVASPCVRICRLNAQDQCEGCLRTLQEIMAWPNLDDDQKRMVLGNVAERRDLLNQPKEA